MDEVTFSVDGGSITSVIGPNGAGKTTLFNLVSGVMRPSGGTITFRGREITGWSASRIARAGLSRTFQNARLFPNLNVLENVMVACRDGSANSHASRFRSREGQRARAEAVLERVGLTGRQCVAWPGELSYANQRRVEVARAIAPDPAFLMLDEPSAGMTHREAEEFFEIVRTLRAEQMTVLLIEHNVRLVMSASDKIVVVNFGKKIAEGPPEVVRDDPVVLEAYLGED